MTNSTELNIAGRAIGIGQAPFVIAEMSGNHNQSLERALEIAEAEAKTGAHGMKIQTYTPDTRMLDLRRFNGVRLAPIFIWEAYYGSNTSNYAIRKRHSDA